MKGVVHESISFGSKDRDFLRDEVHEAGSRKRERNKIFFADWKNNTIFALLFQKLYQTVEIYLLST
jgi:hypothetical protein